METTRRKFNLLAGGAIAWHALPGKSFALSAEGQAGNSAPVARGNTELASLTLAEAAARLRARQVTSVELTQECLERIEIYNPKLDTFITLTKQQAAHALSEGGVERSMKMRRTRAPPPPSIWTSTISMPSRAPTRSAISMTFAVTASRFRSAISHATQTISVEQ